MAKTAYNKMLFFRYVFIFLYYSTNTKTNYQDNFIY